MIEMLNVTKRYPVHGGERTVLDNINLRIRPGEKIGVLGRNGAGKSTMVRIISGAEPAMPTPEMAGAMKVLMRLMNLMTPALPAGA